MVEAAVPWYGWLAIGCGSLGFVISFVYVLRCLVHYRKLS
jgi:hypothetical protein